MRHGQRIETPRLSSTRSKRGQSGFAGRVDSVPLVPVPPACLHPRQALKPIFATRDYITRERFVVGYCRLCKLHVTAPVPPENATERYYPAGYYGKGAKRFTAAVEWLLRGLYNFRVWHIERRQAPGKALDIGCGRGLLLARLRDSGWQTYGTELSRESAHYARSVLNLPVATEPLEQVHYPDNAFDLVILWHVLEHIRDPRAMLQEVRRILKPGGNLLVAVPNFGSWEARCGGRHWFHLDVPRHLTHFTPQTLRAALAEAGLEWASSNFFSSEYDFFSFVQTVQNKLGLPHNLLYNILRTRSAKVLGGKGKEAGPLQLALALLTAVPLALFSLAYAPLAAGLGRGATMAVYAVKRG